MITTFEHKQPTLEAAQEMVGGMVEMVRSPTNPDIQILVNEEGLCGTGIVGNAVILKGDARWT